MNDFRLWFLRWFIISRIICGLSKLERSFWASSCVIWLSCSYDWDLMSVDGRGVGGVGCGLFLDDWLCKISLLVSC